MPSPIASHCQSMLERNPHSPVPGQFGGVRYTARIAIPDYGQRLARHYGQTLSGLDMAFTLNNFGVIIEFDKPTEVSMHDRERRLDDSLRGLVTRFGPLLLRNAYLPEHEREPGQKNVFKSLKFHVDRQLPQTDHYSLFWRDPFDETQRMPRSSSTLILANPAAYLQAVSEGRGPHDFKSLYHLFEDVDLEPLIGNVLLELPWNAPEGTGEIALLDNRAVLHASYYSVPDLAGYPISVRYLY